MRLFLVTIWCCLPTCYEILGNYCESRVPFQDNYFLDPNENLQTKKWDITCIRNEYSSHFFRAHFGPVNNTVISLQPID